MEVPLFSEITISQGLQDCTSSVGSLGFLVSLRQL